MGSHPSLTPRKSMQMSASQNPGIEKPTNTNTVIDRSSTEPRRTADTTPRGMATRKMITMDATLMEMVTGRRSFILSHTGLASEEIDRPKSSLARFFIHTRYCTGRGLSRP